MSGVSKSKLNSHELDSAKLSPMEDSGSLLEGEQKRGWKDNTMQVWGKRSIDSKQASFPEIDNSLHSGVQPSSNNVFSKASDSARFSDKRKWGQNSMQVWGKRNSGTRTALDELSEKLSETDDKKRKWGENSMAVWGKRSGSSGSKNFEEEKRKWGQNNMAVWGKRLNSAGSNFADNDKRKWSDNSMAVWGKRSETPSDLIPTVITDNKRKWSDNSMKVWGKRLDSDAKTLSGYNSNGKDELAFNAKQDDALSDASIEKRKWADNTMQVWGKRSEEKSSNVDQHSLVKRSIIDGGRMTDAELWQSLLARNHNRGLMREGPKRNWETNTMRVWGKRSWAAPGTARTNFYSGYSPLLRRQWQLQSGDVYAPSMSDYLSDVENEATDSDKRAWSSDNGMRVWG